ncbi:MAG: metal-dependent hydrolase [Candidatus Njordarchaeota archaeon]
MPNKWNHILTGALIGSGCIYYHAVIVGRRINQADILILKALLFGGLGGILPDLLEPADNPHHRKFFHSIAFTLICLYENQKLMENTSINEETKNLVSSLTTGYITHLLLDSETVSGLPIV